MVTSRFQERFLFRVRVSEILFESEIPVVLRSVDLGTRIPENGKVFFPLAIVPMKAQHFRSHSGKQEVMVD